jgi:hypothetical protein
MTIPAFAWLLLCAAAFLLGQWSQRHYDVRDPRVRATVYRTLAQGVEMHGGNAITTQGLRLLADHQEQQE